MGPATAWVLMLLFSLLKGLQTGLFAIFIGRVVKRWYAPPVIAAAWVTLEWTHSYTGFEWLNLGNAASDLSLLLRLAPITGVWGLSFAFALMSAVIAQLLLRRRGASLFLLVFPLFYLLPEIPAPTPGQAHAVLVQPNVDGDIIWTPELLETDRVATPHVIRFARHPGDRHGFGRLA